MKAKKEQRPDIHFRMSEDKHRYLVSIAKAMDRSVSYLIESIITDWIERRRAGKE